MKVMQGPYDMLHCDGYYQGIVSLNVQAGSKAMPTSDLNVVRSGVQTLERLIARNADALG